MIISKIISLLSTAIILIESALSLPVLSLNFKFDRQASVFESGDGMYTVIWSTTRPGSGYVTYSYGGKDYTVYDEIGGNILTLDTVHAVRVPKAHIDGNSYTYHSQYVATKLAYSAIKGKTIDSEAVNFKGYSGREINALVLSDIHANPAPAEKAVAGFKTEPSFIILCGDIVSGMEKKSDFLNILDYAYLFSKGEIPVVYARGNHEPRGEYAPEMLKYFRTSQNGLYYTFNYGPIWSVVLDAGEDKEDSHPEYSGLVDFRAYVAEETEWLSGIEADDSAEYKLCIVHKPDFDDLDGEKWPDILSGLGIQASISGHYHKLNLHFQEGSTPFYRLITGGKSGNSDFIATMLTFANGEMKALSINNKGEICADEAFTFNSVK